MSRRGRTRRSVTARTGAGRSWPQVVGEAALILVVLVVSLAMSRASTNILDVKDAALTVGVGLGLAAWIAASLARGRFSWVQSRISPVLAAFVVWAGITIIYSRYRYATVSEFGRLASHAGLYLLAIVALREVRQVRRIIGAACLAAVPVCAYGFIQAAGRDPIMWARVDIRVFSFLGNATYLASFLVLLLPLAVAVGWPQGNRAGSSGAGGRRCSLALLVSILFLAAAGMMALCLYYTVTLSPVIGLGIGTAIAVLLVIVRGGLRVLRVAIPATIVAAVAAATVGTIAYQRLPEGQRARVQAVLHFRDPHADERAVLRGVALHLFGERPVLGWGYGTYSVYSLERVASQWYGELQRPADLMLVPSYAHNEYLQLLSGTGLVGGAIFLALVLISYATALRVYLGHPDDTWRRIGLAVGVGLTAFLFQNFFGVTFRRTGAVTLFWLWVGVLAVAGAGVPGRGEERTEPRVRDVGFGPVSRSRLVPAALALALLWAAVSWWAIRPAIAGVRLKRAEAAAKAGAFQLAAKHAEASIRAYPYFPVAYYIAAYGWGQLGDYEKALAANKKALELLPGNATVQYNLGVTYKLMGSPKEAEASLRRAVELQPTAVQHQAGLAELLLEEGRAEEALRYAGEAVRLAPMEPRCYLLLADIEARRSGDLVKVTQYLRQAAVYGRNDPNIWRQVAELQAGQKQYVEAIAACYQWIRLEPDSARAYNLLGTCYYNRQAYGGARSAFERAVEVEPDYRKARLNLAYAYGKLRRHEMMKRELERLVSTAPDTPEGRTAKTLLELGEKGPGSSAR